MKLKYEFEMMSLGDDTIAVPVGDGAREYRGVVKMNESATRIFQILFHETSEEEILCILKKEYAASEVDLRKCIHETIQQLQERDMLIV